ncbi:MAG: S9 family peptidase [Lachnospiraceae bacterium]|nr:S9 family peptidase [Lachnospiraceae bacterium]
MREGEIADLYLDGKRITRHGERFAKKYALQKPEKLFFKNKDGVEIHGWCLKPARFRKNGHYPAILHIHGGPATVFGNVPHHEMQLWAAKGYFVFYCNPRGSDGRGNDFINISGKYGSIDYEDIMAFTDRILKAYPMIDKTRVGVTGGSYGGFMTNWIIGHTNRFACACAQRSICNWITFEHTSDIGPVFTKLQQGAYTRDNMKSLWDKSPLKYADKAVTPTLFVCGDEDYRCYYADSVSMFTALQENGTPAKIALFHGENHELSRSGKPKNRIARMQEILDWMDHWLK